MIRIQALFLRSDTKPFFARILERSAMFGILCCTSRSRVLNVGIPFRPFPHGEEQTVRSKKYATHHRDVWVKVNPVTMELMEVLGSTGEYAVELKVLLLHFNVMTKFTLAPPLPASIDLPIDADTVHAVTVDGPTTLDRDDAISVTMQPDGTTKLGIHITDLTAHLPMEWLAWATQRASSCYWDGTSSPIFPKELAHGMLSLEAGRLKPCLSLYLIYRGTTLVSSEWNIHDRIRIEANLTYDTFQLHPWCQYLKPIAKSVEASEIVAWCMIEYNRRAAAEVPNMLLRVQSEEGVPATYALEGTHATIGGTYGHFTSPIRRVADYYNQCIWKQSLLEPWTMETIQQVNDRMDQVKAFHRLSTMVAVGYQCKVAPIRLPGKVVMKDEEKGVTVVVNERTYWIPLYDSFVKDTLENGTTLTVELHGILKHGRMTLRVVWSTNEK